MTESEVPESVMTETDELKQQQPPHKLNTTNVSFSIWPPAQRTRDAVTNRLIETLSTPSVISKRYGTMTAEEAASIAKHIEDEAFAAAGGAGSDDNTSADDDGIEILQIYSKEISRRMLETVKARADADDGDGDGAAAFPTPTKSVASNKVEVSSAVESESA